MWRATRALRAWAGCHDRQRYLFGLQGGGLQQLLLGPGPELGLSHDTVLTFLVEEAGILLVDFLLLFRRRVRARDVEAAALHEIEIGVPAAGLAPAGEFRVALDQLRRLFFPGRCLFGLVGAFLEIGRCARPPLRLGAQGHQPRASRERRNQQGGFRRH